MYKPQEPVTNVTINPKKKVSFLKSLTIKAKLRLAFLGTLGLLVLYAVIANSFMANINNKSTEIEVNWMPSILVVNAINTTTGDYRITEMLHVLTTDEIQMERIEKDLARLEAEIVKLRTRYETLISSPEEKTIYQNFSAQYEEYMSASKQTITFSRANQNEEAARQLKGNGVLFETFKYDLNKLVVLNQEGGLQASHEGDQLFVESEQISVFVGLVVFMIILVFLILFEQGISTPLQRLTGLVQRLAQGYVSDSSHFQARFDEIGQMTEAVEEVTQTLKTLTSDALELIEAAQAGVLSVRVEAERHPGEFSKIVTGMNQLLEVLSKPLNEIAQVMQNLALGELSGRMQGNYEGELQALKLNVNRSLDALVNLLSELTAITERMAKGDLTHSLTGNYQGEFSGLKANVNQAIMQMTEILKIISANIESSAVATTQTAEAATHVSTQASRQMTALEEVAVTVEETASSVQEVARSATKGNELAHESTALAKTGSEQLNKLILLIQQVGNQYGRIEQITSEITRIADKTHLLSLNAGLEAMRAGEHGLGFGFVAQQIGKLAEEVTVSAHDIGAVITSSAENVRLGVQTAEETHLAMAQITEAAKSSGEMVQNISAAIVQQSVAVQSLAERLSEIQSSSESTAAAAEEISHTVAQLAETAQQTATQVQRFSLSA